MIATKRLVLKPYRDEDQEAMIELLTNEKIKETFMIPDFRSREEAILMFQKLKEFSYNINHYELGIYKEETLIGFINDVDMKEDKIELGYVIHPEFQNQGYATEVLAAAIEDLFQKGFHEIITGAFASNVASCRVMEKCGMKRIDKEEDIFYHNQSQHCIYYSIKKADAESLPI